MKFLQFVICISLLSSVFSFKQRYHSQITHDALLELGFSEKAAEKVASANWWTDIYEYYKSEAHFDDEQFIEGNKRLLQFRSEIISNSNSQMKQKATWEKLGKALHGLQDFYSHSTWINTGHNVPYSTLGISDFSPRTYADDVCTDFEVLTDYGKRSDILTSGYFSLTSCSSFPTGKCRHGFVGCRNGLNKDEPGRSLHEEALDVAKQSTHLFVSSILGQLVSLEAEKFLKGIESNRSDVDMVIVIDTTGSMTEEIFQVKQTVTNIILSSVKPNRYILVPYGDPIIGPVYITSNDSEILFRVNSLYASGGGADCPELGWTALQVAASNAVEESPVFFFSDASNKDVNVMPATQKLFVDKRLVPYLLLTGYCDSTKRQTSSVDPNYTQFTSNTGGQTFITNPNQLSRYTSLISSELAADNSLVYLVSGTMETNGRISPNCSQYLLEIAVPLDTEGNRTTISISYDSAITVQLFSPNGTLVNASKALISSSLGGVIYVMNTTEYGSYLIKICGSGKYSVRVSKGSTIKVQDFQFVSIGGRYADSLVPFPSYPIFGQSSPFLLIVHGVTDINATQATITLLNGTEYGNVSISIEEIENDTITYFGYMTVPINPFYIKVRIPYNAEIVTRYSPVSRPQSIGVSIIGEISRQISSKANSTIYFNITNFGPTASFSVSVSITNTTISPTYRTNVTALRNITLSTGRSAIVNATIFPLAGVQNGSIHNLVFTVSSLNSSNSLTTILEAVGCASCSGVGSCVLNQSNYVCLCPFDRREADCSMEAHCLPRNCNGNGKCNILPEKPVCICNEGWEGPGCENPIAPVVSDAQRILEFKSIIYLLFFVAITDIFIL